jgi:hypothetical protein
MRYALRRSIGIPALAFIIFVVALAFACPGPITPTASSDTYDCDDSALAMYHYFQGLGLEATPIIGNLKMDGEEYMESNHVWLLVRSGEWEIAYDWGTPRLDRQHYEGYEISLEMLIAAVEQDRQGTGELASPGQ